MLELMGYRKVRDNLLVFEDPIDPDRVSGVSKDSMIASVECQIMRSIYGEVFKNKEIKWMDIFLFRENYPGSEEEAIAALSLPANPFEIEYGNPSAYFQSVYPVSQPVPYVISPHQGLLKFGLNYFQIMPQLQSDQVYHSDGYHYRQALPEYHHTRITQRGSQYVTCPTGQLIEYDTSLHQPAQSSVAIMQSHHGQVGQHHRRSSSDHAVSSSGVGDMNYVCHGRRPSHGYRTSDSSNAWGLDTEVWRTCSQEFIDREEQSNMVERNPAYFHKDINNSGNWLNRDHAQKSEVNKSCVNMDELDDTFKELWKDEMANYSDLNRQPLNNARKKKKYRDITQLYFDKETSRSKKNSRDNSYSGTLRVKLDSSAPSEEDSTKWSCQFCTFLNLPMKEVCEICGKSKVPEAEVPLASGGRQCPKCTLVNKRGALKCDVCDTSLKDSPTYI
uniref:RanBP2-type domain-containing protein n=1 Tax=Rhodnius prolixus TaxID=13249 RepID=A0ABL0EG27_RHOPR